MPRQVLANSGDPDQTAPDVISNFSIMPRHVLANSGDPDQTAPKNEFESRHDKTNVRLAKTQVSLGIRPV